MLILELLFSSRICSDLSCICINQLFILLSFALQHFNSLYACLLNFCLFEASLFSLTFSSSLIFSFSSLSSSLFFSVSLSSSLFLLVSLSFYFIFTLMAVFINFNFSCLHFSFSLHTENSIYQYTSYNIQL